MTHITALDLAPDLLGESPLWHPEEQALYWCDIPGRSLNRYDPASTHHDRWHFDIEPACCAPMQDGGVLLAMRDGLWRFDRRSGRRHLLAAPPYDPAHERFNDGKCDRDGRFWSATIYEPRDQPRGAVYRYHGQTLTRVADDITVGNGLAWSPDDRTIYHSDTKAHTIYASDFDASTGTPGPRRIFASFQPRREGQPLDTYGGRPDGAAVDIEGCYWVAMFEGQRLLRLSPEGRMVNELRLPVRCATMPCFGGTDLRTLYITTARDKRPAAELEAQPLAGKVLTLRVDVPGLPANLYR